MYQTKKCPECYSYLEVEANACDVCNTRVKKTYSGGLAKRAINWISYAHCFLAWVCLGIFVWWGFFKV
jgi:hypothetical protein